MKLNQRRLTPVVMAVPALLTALSASGSWVGTALLGNPATWWYASANTAGYTKAEYYNQSGIAKRCLREGWGTFRNGTGGEYKIGPIPVTASFVVADRTWEEDIYSSAYTEVVDLNNTAEWAYGQVVSNW